MISIAIIEDIDEIRNSLKEFFTYSENLLCEIAANSVESFIETLKQGNKIKPDIILLDIGLPGISGINGMPLIREILPDIDFIMLTVYEDDDKIFRSLQAGATGYLIKTTPFPQIAKAIEDIFKGGSAMSPSIARKVIQYFSQEKSSKSEVSLTVKEKEIAQYLVDGYSYSGIAEILGNSVETIRHHIKKIYKKLQVNSKLELINKSFTQKF